MSKRGTKDNTRILGSDLDESKLLKETVLLLGKSKQFTEDLEILLTGYR